MSIVRYQFGGQCYPGEIWRVGVDCAAPPAGTTPTPSELMTDLTTRFNQFNTSLWTTLKALNRNSVDLSYGSVRVYNGIPGPLSLQGSYEANFTPVTGTASTPVLAGSSALVATKISDTATRNGRGRMYLPLTGAQLEPGSGQAADANCTTIANAVAAYYALINLSTITIGGVVHNLNAVILSQLSAPLPSAYSIKSVRVESRVDRQVRRQINTVSQFTALATV